MNNIIVNRSFTIVLVHHTPNVINMNCFIQTSRDDSYDISESYHDLETTQNCFVLFSCVYNVNVLKTTLLKNNCIVAYLNTFL